MVEFADRLMPLQVDPGGGEALKRLVNGLGVEVRTATRSTQVVADRSGGTISTEDYEELAEEISGQDLDHFFAVWLHTPEKPTAW